MQLIENMVARDGVEPPTPAFSGLRSAVYRALRHTFLPSRELARVCIPGELEGLNVYKIDYTTVDVNPEFHFKYLKGLVGERGFEPPTPGPEPGR